MTLQLFYAPTLCGLMLCFQCAYHLKKYQKAKASFVKARKYEKVATAAGNWIKYVDGEVYRINELKKEIVINTDVKV